MRAAAAALVGAVLFFVGVLGATPDGERLAPPSAIPLGTAPQASPAAHSGEVPATGDDDGRPGNGGQGDPVMPVTGGEGGTPPAGDAPAGPAPASAPVPPATPASEPAPSAPSAPVPSRTADPGPSATPDRSPPAGGRSDGIDDVEDVEGEVDCVDVGSGRGRATGRSDACPPEGKKPKRDNGAAPRAGGGRDGTK